MTTPALRPVFIHVPRTAGTSTRQLLHTIYGSGVARVLETGRVARGAEPDCELRVGIARQYGDPATLSALTPEWAAQTKAWHGHWPWGLHKFLPYPVQYATVLRHPVDRFLSAWRYVRLHPEEPGKATFDAANSTNDPVEAHHAVGRVSRFLDNPTTRLLAGLHPWDVSPRYQDLAEGIHEVAIEHLEEMIVGIFDMLPDTIRLFTHAFNWPAGKTLNVVNVLPEPKPELCQRAYEDLLVLERHDLAVYRRGLELFREQMRTLNGVT